MTNPFILYCHERKQVHSALVDAIAPRLHELSGEELTTLLYGLAQAEYRPRKIIRKTRLFIAFNPDGPSFLLSLFLLPDPWGFTIKNVCINNL